MSGILLSQCESALQMQAVQQLGLCRDISLPTRERGSQVLSPPLTSKCWFGCLYCMSVGFSLCNQKPISQWHEAMHTCIGYIYIGHGDLNTGMFRGEQQIWLYPFRVFKVMSIQAFCVTVTLGVVGFFSYSWRLTVLQHCMYYSLHAWSFIYYRSSVFSTWYYKAVIKTEPE